MFVFRRIDNIRKERYSIYHQIAKFYLSVVTLAIELTAQRYLIKLNNAIILKTVYIIKYIRAISKFSLPIRGTHMSFFDLTVNTVLIYNIILQ